MQHIFTPADAGAPTIEILKSSPAETHAEIEEISHYTPSLDEIEAEVVEEDYDPRSALPQIRPGLGKDNRAGIVMGSAEPPHRPGYRR